MLYIVGSYLNNIPRELKCVKYSNLLKCNVLAKVDLRKELKHPYSPSVKEPQIVDVPAMNFIMIDGSFPKQGLRVFTKG